MDSQLWVPVPKIQSSKSGEKKSNQQQNQSQHKPSHSVTKNVPTSGNSETKTKPSESKPKINISKVLDNQEKFSLDIKINKKRTLDDMFDDDFDEKYSLSSNTSPQNQSSSLDTLQADSTKSESGQFHEDKSSNDQKLVELDSKTYDTHTQLDESSSSTPKSQDTSSSDSTHTHDGVNTVDTPEAKRQKTDPDSKESDSKTKPETLTPVHRPTSPLSNDEPLSERLKSLKEEVEKEEIKKDAAPKVKTEPVEKKEETVKDEPPKVKIEKETVPAAKKEPAVKKEKKIDPIVIEDTIEPINRWWEDIDDDMDYNKGLEYESKSNHWKYLEHNGMIFTPEYVPHNIPIKVKGQDVFLPPPVEEIATMWAQSIGTNYETSEIYCKNFWTVFASKFEKDHPIRKCRLYDIDFSQIKNHLEDEKQKKKDNREYYKAKQQEDAKREYKFNYALVDWIREKVSSNRLEPPGLFKGRGLHPKQGMLKLRMFPKDVILNLSKDAPVPKVSNFMREGHCWKDIYHDNSVTWLSYYKDSINDQYKYMYLSAQSKFKGFHDFLKYNKARELKLHIHKIREDYNSKMLSLDMYEKQLGTAVYLIDFLALRVGGEKDVDEADTVGCCSLRVEHIKFSEKKKNTITLDFLGKDSIRYFNTVALNDVAYGNLVKFCHRKKPSAEIFNLINTSKLNDYLKELMDGLSAKVFRTYNASITLQNQFKRLRSKKKNIGNIGLLKNHGEETLDRSDAGDIGDDKTDLDTGRTTSTISSTFSDGTTATADSIDINNIDDSTESSSESEDSSTESVSVKEEEEEHKVKTEKAETDVKLNLEAVNGDKPVKKESKPVDRNKDVTVDLSNLSELLQFYNYANREVAILCNHQRSIPKQHETSMSKLKIQANMLKEDIQELTEYLKHLQSNSSEEFKFTSKTTDVNGNPRKLMTKPGMKMEAAKNRLATLKKRQKDHAIKMRIKDSNKTVALGTSKINYMDPRITVAFCKKYEIPIEKIFNKTLRMKFPWAMYVRSDFKF